MRVAIVSPRPHEVLCDKVSGWVADGFRAAGNDVRLCHTLPEVKAADAECDLVLLDHKAPGVCQNSLADMALRKRSKWIQWYRDLVAFYCDLPLEEQPYMRGGLRRLMRNCDLVFVKERSLLGEYKALGINARWFDQACPADMPQCEHRDNPEFDVLVPGVASYDQRRADARALVDAGFRVAFCGLPCNVTVPEGCTGLPWAHPVRELPQFVSRSAVVLGVDWRSDLPGFTSDRVYLACGMGACYVRRSSPGMVEIPSFAYASHDRLISLVGQLTRDVARRRQTGEAARKLVMDCHTYRNRAMEIVQMVEQLQ